MMTAGLAEVDITPPIGCALSGYAARTEPARAVRDALLARALVLESHGRRIAIVGADLIGVDAEFTSAVRAAAEEQCGIPGEAVLVCGSHTHFGPALRPTGYLPDHLERAVSPGYAQETAVALAGAIVQADRTRAPAGVGAGCGWDPFASINRRPVDDEGQCQMAFTAPDDVAVWAAGEGAPQAAGALGRPELAATMPWLSAARPKGPMGELHWGPTDPQVPVLRVEGESGPLGVVVSYACHPVCGAGDEAFYDISADYPWALRRTLDPALGARAVFGLGCAGDQVPIKRGPGSRERVGRSLGGEVLRIWDMVDTEDDLPLGYGSRTVALPLKSFAGLDVPEGDEAYARHARHMAAKYAGRDSLETEVQALRIGPMGLVALPGEIFVAIGHAIKRQSPFPLTMPISQANDSVGYIPTPEAYAQGGYEPTWNAVGPGAAAALTAAAVDVLQTVSR
jgi:Neutral/alkaline non-lysosomal ceramidase, N-terminal